MIIIKYSYIDYKYEVIAVILLEWLCRNIFDSEDVLDDIKLILLDCDINFPGDEIYFSSTITINKKKKKIMKLKWTNGIILMLWNELSWQTHTHESS